MAAAVDDADDTWSDAEEADAEPSVAAVTEPTKVFATFGEALAFDRERGFDLAAVCRSTGVDFYGAVKVLNFARATVARRGGPWDNGAGAALTAACVDGADWRDDAYLKPVLEPDELLHRLEDALDLADEDESPAVAQLRADLEGVRSRVEAAAAKIRDGEKFDGAAADETPVDASAPLEARLAAELEAAKLRLIAMEARAL